MIRRVSVTRKGHLEGKPSLTRSKTGSQRGWVETEEAGFSAGFKGFDAIDFCMASPTTSGCLAARFSETSSLSAGRGGTTTGGAD